MALRTIKRLATRSAGEAPKPKIETIEQIRAKHPLGSFELVVGELVEYRRYKKIAGEATNAMNRQNTLTKKAIKAYAVQTGMKPTDEIRYEDTAYLYDVAYQDKIDVETMYKLVKAGKISEDVFLQVISVNKAKATLLIGAHILNDIIKTEPGKTFDIRTKPLDQPANEPVVVKAPPPAPKKLNRQSEQAPARAGGVTKVRRIRNIG